MATARRGRCHGARHQNVQPFSGLVIDLTSDNPVACMPFAEQTSTNQNVTCPADATGICTPVKQARVKDYAAKKPSKKGLCDKKVPEAFTCPVCFEELQFHSPKPDKQAMSTLCGHMFCYACIVATISKREECPMCRKKQTIQSIHPLYV